MTDGTHSYDIAVSFAGAQRGYVERVVRACEARGVRVFYDRNETVRLWGNNVITQLRTVYGGIAARYVVPFLSWEYLAGPYPMDELDAAIQAGVERGAGYILPILMDDVIMPREILGPAIVYLRAGDYTPEELARVIGEKIGAARQRHREPREVSGTVEQALRIRLPRIAPTGFSGRSTLEGALVQVGKLFQQAAPELTQFGLTCGVRISETAVTVRVEERQRPICELSLSQGGTMWSGRLVTRFAWPQITGDAANGLVRSEWDTEARQPKFIYDDFSRIVSGPNPRSLTVDELFDELWKKIVDFIEKRG